MNMGALVEASVMTRPLTTQAISRPNLKLVTCVHSVTVSVGVSVIGFRVFGLDRGARAALLRRLVRC